MKIGDKVSVTYSALSSHNAEIYGKEVFTGKVEYITNDIFGVRGFHEKYKSRLWGQSKPVLESFRIMDKELKLIKVVQM